MSDKTNGRHFLFLSRSFWPDIEGSGQSFTALCEELAKIYKVTVIAGRSYYTKDETFGVGRIYGRETFNGIEILRVRHSRFWKKNIFARAINWITYSFFTFIAALRMKSEAIIVGTDPPFLGIIAMIVSWLKSIPYIYCCMDIYPDCALEIGRLRRGFLSYIFDYCNRKALNKARLVVSLGESMEDRLRAKGVREQQIKTIPLWIDTTIIKPVAKADNPLVEKLGLKNKFIIMYSGNIGLSQDFSSILQSVATFKDRSSFYLVFIGEGAAKESLKDEVRALGLENVLFLPYQPKDLLLFSLGMADLHLVPLKKGLGGASVPGKVYAIMAVARPYLAITDRESEPARLVKEYGCGLWAAPQDIRAIAKVFSWAISHPTELERMGNIGRHIAETKFDKGIIVKEWLTALDSIVKIRNYV